MMNGDTELESPSKDHQLSVQHTLPKDSDYGGGPQTSSLPEVTIQCLNGVMDEDTSEDARPTSCKKTVNMLGKSDETSSPSAGLNEESCEFKCDDDNSGMPVNVNNVSVDHMDVTEKYSENLDKDIMETDCSTITPTSEKKELSREDRDCEESHVLSKNVLEQPLEVYQTGLLEGESADNQNPANEKASVLDDDQRETDNRDETNIHGEISHDIELKGGNEGEETAMEVDEVDGRPCDGEDGAKTLQDQVELASSALHGTTDNCDSVEPEETGELRFEISDVRTVDVEEDESDSSASMAVVDLDQPNISSQDTEDEFSSPICRDKMSKGQDSRTAKTKQSHDSAAKGRTDQNISSVLSSREVGNNSSGSKQNKESNAGNVQKSVDRAFEVDTEADILQDLYNQTSSLHDPELSTMNTTEADDETAKVSPVKSTLASDLLSNLADTVKKIKSEPKDGGYEKAMNASTPTEQHTITNLSLGERLRLPPSMCQSAHDNEVITRIDAMKTITSMQITPDIPPPSVMPFMSVVVTTSQSCTQTATVSNALTTNVISPGNNAMQIATNSRTQSNSTAGNASVQTKTVAYLVPVSHPDKSSNPVFVSIPSLASKSSDKVSTNASTKPTPVPSSSANVKQKVVLMKGVQGSNDGNDTSVRNFEEDVLNMCQRHQVKSVNLTKVTGFLQRKNAIKSYKWNKPPDCLKVDKKGHNCLECGDSFALQTSLDYHLKRCSLKITYFCSVCDCDKHFYNKCQLLSHMRQHSNAPNPNKPPPPLKIHSDLISILTPSVEDLKTCYQDYVFTPNAASSAEKQQNKCLICCTEFTDEDQLRIHFGYDDVICSFAYQCPNCPQILPRQCALKAHINNHRRSLPFVCPECGKVFSSKSYEAFSEHLTDNCFHSNRICLLECTHCRIKLEGVPRTKQHLLNMHVKNFMKCRLCSLAFDQKQRFESHVKNSHNIKHGTVVPLTVSTCEICKSLLQTKELLERHMELHVLEMKKNAQFGYKCTDCKKQTVYTTKTLLFQHKQICHYKGPTQHRCDVCGFKVDCLDLLKLHEMTRHNRQGDQKKVGVVFKCGKCETTHSSAASLNKHVCKPPPTKPMVVGMCARCKVIIPTMDFVSHQCALGSVTSKPSVASPQTAKIAPAPFPVHLLSIPQGTSDKAVSAAQPNNSPTSKTSAESKSSSVSNCRVSFWCMNCKTVFASKGLFEGHKLSCKKNDPYFIKTGRKKPVHQLSCNLCSVRFPTRKRLTLHIKEHQKRGNPMCTLCNIVAFKTDSELEQHLLTCNHVSYTEVSQERERCKVCEKEMYPFEKVKHLKSHRLKGTLICPYCQKMDFSDKEEFDFHKIDCGYLIRPLELGYCYTCHAKFSTLEQLVVHLQDHVKEGTLVCCKCQRTGFKSKKLLQEHHESCGRELMESMPGQMCSLCREAFPGKDISQLYRHLTLHVIRGVHICCKCQKMGWENHGEVKSHQIGCGVIDMKHGNKTEQLVYKCKICHKGFRYWEPLRKHVRKHRDSGSLICLRCLKIGWKNAVQLSEHEGECLSSGIPETVYQRDNAIRESLADISESEGADHERPETMEDNQLEFKDASLSYVTGQGYKTMDHFCEHCGKKYSELSLLQDHISKEHVSFPCHLCGLAYDSKSALVSHVNVVHDGKRCYFSCDICKSKQISRKFASHQGLQKHMQKAHKHSRRSSSNDGKEVEDVDVQSSPTSSVAVNPTPSPPPMKRLRVEGDSAYTCAKCSFVTDDAAKFSEHIKDHNTDKASQCPECGLCFTILPALKKHLFMVHKIRDSEKYLEDKGMKTEEEEFNSDYEDVSPVVKRFKSVDQSDEEESSSGNPLECSVCHIDFPCEKQLKTHLRIHGMAFIRSRRRARSKLCASTSPEQESPPKSGNPVSSSPSVEIANGDPADSKSEVRGEENTESFPMTILREETMEGDRLVRDKDGSCPEVKESFENLTVKQEAMDCSD